MSTQIGALAPKPHYEILDGLRGVAALIVVAFHLLEIHMTGTIFPIINHGYMAVDFFFLLSGFVIGYAYDDRWGKMSLGNFFKRRVIRLQPMVVLGGLIGGACFYFGEGSFFHLISQTSFWTLIGVTVLGCLLIPIPPRMDVRCWGESYPLNGPAWSLFYEYIANILYGLFVRRFSKLWLTIFVIISGLALARLALVNGSVLGGHQLDGNNLLIGLTRVMYPFFCGVLLFRLGRLIKVKAGFWLCSLALAGVLFFPYLGEGTPWINGLFESTTILVVFPLIVLAGAGSTISGGISTRLCQFLGQVSFPLYIIHYPIVYLYMSYVKEHDLTTAQTWPLMVAIWAGCIALAYGCLKLIDEPVRKWLTAHFMK